MKTRILAAAIVMADISSAFADPATGLWKTQIDPEEGYMLVQITECSGALCGTIASAHDPSGRELSDFPHRGHRLLWNLEPDGDGHYENGEAQLPDMNRSFRANLELEGEDLNVKVCMVGGALCDQETWTRIE